MSKPKRATWFKLFLTVKPAIDAVPDDAVGRAVKAALAYFESGEQQNLDGLAGVVFAMLRPSVDEAVEDYQQAVAQGRIGGQKRWGAGEGNDAAQ